MKTCEDVNELLGPWLDRELSAADAEAVRAHVADCAECGEEARQLERLDAIMKSALAPAAAEIAFAPFWRDVRHRIETRRAWPATVADRIRSAFRGPALAWAVPAVIVLLIGAFSFDSLWQGLTGRTRNNFAVVESIDAHGRNVAVFREDDTKTTVIWLYQEEDNETYEEPPADASF
jgi:anti-sigma factor RsiW